MRSLIAFATQWGSKYGGINSFNTDFLTAFGDTYQNEVQVICIVSLATESEIAQAKEKSVTLVQLPYPPENKIFTSPEAKAAIGELKNQAIQFEPDETVWLGHDRISGEAAICAATLAGGRSALIHHMSYDTYEAFAEDSHSANTKTDKQTSLFKQANLVLAVGSFLHRALGDMLDKPKEDIHLIIPGLEKNIDPRKTTPSIFSAFLSGRLSDDAAKIKQGHLGVAGFAQAIANANQHNSPNNLIQKPKLLLRGVDFESSQNYNQDSTIPPETELQQFAEKYAGRRINLQALPFTQDRDELYNNLKSASVALMPSWHEGFGLVAWEAIAAGVPLIVSKESGVYEFLDKQFKTGLVEAITVRGASEFPFFHDDDLSEVANAITRIAQDPEKARERAAELRKQLSTYTWESCVTGVADYFTWQLKKNTAITETPTDNTLSSPLEMPRKYWQQSGVYPESLLLRADEALVPFDAARQPAIDQLNTWLDDEKFPTAIRLMTGAGGLGKTRLAIEICEQRKQHGWHCGFLSKENSAKEMATAWQQLLAFKQPILLVIDYAETRQAVLLAFIKALLKNPSPQPVRLLLLARNGGEWWDNLPSKDADCEVLLGGYATSGPYALPELYLDTNSRHLAYTSALEAYANATGRIVPHVLPDLSGEHFAKPLYLQMAALLALYGERPATAEGLTSALLNHERRYWAKALADTQMYQAENYAQHLLALATLSGGFATPKQAQTFFGDGLTTAKFTALFNALVPLYPASRQGLQTVQPDLLGEALVAKALAETNSEELLNATLGNKAVPVVHHHALTVIARISDHRPLLATRLTQALTRHFLHCYKAIVEVAVETRSQLSTLAQAAFTNLPVAEKSQVVGLLPALLQNESVELARLGYAVHLFLMEKSKKKLAKKPNDINLQIEHANNLNNLSIRLYWLGGDIEAIDFAKEALAIMQSLAEKNPDRFEPDYAASLNNYANRLSNVGHNEEAISHAEEALAIQKRLAEKNPDRFEPNYAMYLNNYASHLGDVGQNEEAISHAKQALIIRQRLAAKNPDRFEPDYAMSLSNSATHLSAVGHNEEAISHAKQALIIRQRLAAKNPDRFEPDYATSLGNYAIHLSTVGQNEEAISHAEEAMAIQKRLAEKNPDRFEPDYAMSLSNYAGYLSHVGNNDGAVSHAKKALTIRQHLAEKNPDRFESDYATSLNNYANHLSDVGNYEEAISHAKQALTIWQRLAQNTPARYEIDYYQSWCDGLFFSWLANKTLVNPEMQEAITRLPSIMTDYQKATCLFYSHFVQACLATTATQQAEQFKLVLEHWLALSKADQHAMQDCFLSGCAWLHQHEPSALTDIDWLDNWQQFQQQRHNRLPHWMQKLAQRLSFQFPAVIKSIE